MKLGELRGLIRKTKGSPAVRVRLGEADLNLLIQKTPLLEELEKAFPGGKMVETGLTFNDGTGLLDVEGAAVPLPELDLDVRQDVDEAFELDLSEPEEDDELLV